MTREKAIEQLKDLQCHCSDMNRGENVYSEWAKDIIAIDMAIESLEQEPKTGHWILTMDCEGKNRKCTCDKCGYETGKYTWHNPNYCPNCGAEMRGTEND